MVIYNFDEQTEREWQVYYYTYQYRYLKNTRKEMNTKYAENSVLNRQRFIVSHLQTGLYALSVFLRCGQNLQSIVHWRQEQLDLE